QRTPWVGPEEIRSKGLIVVWPASDTAGVPPPDIAARFPELVPEVPRAFVHAIQGRLPLARIGWGMLRPVTPGTTPAPEPAPAPGPAPRGRASVIALAGAQLAAKEPVDECVIEQDDRQQDRGANQGEYLARRRRRGLPHGERWRHQVGIGRDHQAEIAEKK